jgi:hypothetical protein
LRSEGALTTALITPVLIRLPEYQIEIRKIYLEEKKKLKMRILYLSAFVKGQIGYNESEIDSIDQINERKHEASKEMV